MAWQLQEMPGPVPAAERKPGMYWFCRPEFLEQNEDVFSPNYHADWAGKRLPITVCLPDGSMWCPDQRPTYGSNTIEGWKVTGDLPRITARPSVGKPGYHGFLTDGVLSDDLDGRTFR